MTGPINLNQVIYQAPQAEKVQLAGVEAPDHLKRHAAQQTEEQSRLLRESVQQAEKTEQEAIKDKQEREQQRQGRDRGESGDRSGSEPESETTEGQSGQGGIVNVVV
jgi:hypothetical protein